MSRSNLDTPATQLKMIREYAEQYAELRAAGDVRAVTVGKTLDKLLRVLKREAPALYPDALGIVTRVAVAAAERDVPAYMMSQRRNACRTPAYARDNSSRSALDAKAETLSEEQIKEWRELDGREMPKSRKQYYMREFTLLKKAYGALRENRTRRRGMPAGAIVVTKQMMDHAKAGVFHPPPYFTPKDVSPIMLALLGQVAAVAGDAKVPPEAREAAAKSIERFSSAGVIPPQGIESLALGNRDPHLVRKNHHLVSDADKRAYLRAAQMFFGQVAYLADKFRPFMTDALAGDDLSGVALDAAYTAVEDALQAAKMHGRVDEMRERQIGTSVARNNAARRLSAGAGPTATRESVVFTFATSKQAWAFMRRCDEAGLVVGFPGWRWSKPKAPGLHAPDEHTVAVRAADAEKARALLSVDLTPVVDGDTGAFAALPARSRPADLTPVVDGDTGAFTPVKPPRRNAAHRNAPRR